MTTGCRVAVSLALATILMVAVTALASASERQAKVTQGRNAGRLQTDAEKEAEKQLVKAQRLQDAGFESEARKLTRSVAENSTTPIPAKLRAINQRVGWWRDLLGLGGPVARTALELLGALLGVLVATLLIFTAVGALARRFRRSGQLGAFTGSSDAALPSLLGSVLGSMLARMSDEAAIPRVDWQSGTEFKFNVPPALVEAVPQANLVAGLVQMLDGLLYRRLFIVSGTVHPVHTHRGAGVTLVVTNRSGRKSEQITLWEREFLLKEAGADAPDAVRYERLMLPGAIWLAYRPMTGFRKHRRLALHRGYPLGTREWRSYALFSLGELVPDAVKERQLYELALDRDAENLGARLNLAGLLLRRSQGGVPQPPNGIVSSDVLDVQDGGRERWKECLKEAGEHLADVASKTSPKRDPIWYRALYMQAVRLIYEGDGSRAKEILTELDNQMGRRARKPKLHALVQALEQPIQVLEMTAELIEKRSVGEGKRRLPGGWLTATAEYNQACFWSRYAGVSNDVPEGIIRTRKALSSLRRAVERMERARGEARIDPAFDPIRENEGFKAIVKEPPEKQPVEKPTRYAITLDPGPELISLARVQSPT